MIARGARRAADQVLQRRARHDRAGSRVLARSERLGARGRPVVDRDPEAVVGDVEGEVLAHHAEPDQADLRLTCHPPNALLLPQTRCRTAAARGQSRADPFSEKADDRSQRLPLRLSCPLLGGRLPGHRLLRALRHLFRRRRSTSSSAPCPTTTPRSARTTGTDFNIVRSRGGVPAAAALRRAVRGRGRPRPDRPHQPDLRARDLGPGREPSRAPPAKWSGCTPIRRPCARYRCRRSCSNSCMPAPAARNRSEVLGLLPCRAFASLKLWPPPPRSA